MIVDMEEKREPTYFELFRAFFHIGLTGFGGLAITAHIRKHVVDKREWIDAENFDSGLALCQVIPGAIVMQLVAYIGLKIKGIPGAVISFFAFGLPSFLIMFLLSVLYEHSRNITGVEAVLRGLRIIIVAIVANAAFIFGKKNISNRNDLLIAILAAVMFLAHFHPLLVLLISAFMGLMITKKKTGKPAQIIQTRTFWFFAVLLLLVLASTGVLYFISREHFTLASLMLRIDLLSFGGGLAAMPVMYHELVDLFHWVNEQTFMDGVILGQVTPGSIIIAATFFGYVHLGVPGSLLATICVFTPSFLILMGLMPFYDKLRSYPQFDRIINGILCSFVGLLAIVTYRFSLDVQWSMIRILLAVGAFALLLRKVDIIWVLLGGIALAVVI
jgi:chromate transporter